ncbi:MAG: AmmeMemoRadiSam system protein A [Halorhodospira sp.]
MSSIEHANDQQPIGTELPEEHGSLLPRLAYEAIAHHQATGRTPELPAALPQTLYQPGAAFVSLHQRESLRGCMGTLTPRQPLVHSVRDSAINAAFNDPRFEAVQRDELDALTVEVSVLGEAEPVHADSEEELLERLRPGQDGLILQEGPRQATFLPAVWTLLPDPRAFLAQLKLKAGLQPDYWSATLQFARYPSRTFRLPPESG